MEAYDDKGHKRKVSEYIGMAYSAKYRIYVDAS